MFAVALMIFATQTSLFSNQTVLGHLTNQGPVFDVPVSVLQAAIGEELSDGSSIGALAIVQRSDNGAWVLTAHCIKDGIGHYMVYFDLHTGGNGDFTVPLTANPRMCACTVTGCPITDPIAWYCTTPPCSGGCAAATCTESCKSLNQIGYIGSFH